MKGFIFLICFVPFVYGIGASPAQLDFVGNTGEVICKNVTISDVEGVVLVEDRWAIEGSDDRDFLAHRLDGVGFGLDVDYEENFTAEGGTEREVCVSGKMAGFYHGVLLIKGDGDNSGVGIWVVVDLVGVTVISLEGMSVISSEEDPGIVLVLVFVLLLLVLIVVML